MTGVEADETAIEAVGEQLLAVSTLLEEINQTAAAISEKKKPGMSRADAFGNIHGCISYLIEMRHALSVAWSHAESSWEEKH